MRNSLWIALNLLHSEPVLKVAFLFKRNVPANLRDVVELKMRGLGIPVCNIICGYYDAHRNSEYTKFTELQNCLSIIKEAQLIC